jgi:hypothetical protein
MKGLEVRASAIALLKMVLARGMRYRLGFKLTRLISEEHQLFAHGRIAAACAPALTRRLGDTVLHGPFSGLRYPEASGVSTDRVRKLLGAYEAELHAVLEEICDRPYRTVVNIGAAEGYYAVGLAYRLPSVTVVAFERDAGARRSLQQLAELNGVASRVQIGGYCTLNALAECPLGTGTLIVSDCEGCEYDLLQPGALPGLVSCDFLVELHRRRELSPRRHFTDLFGKTHRITFIDTRRRDPSAYPELAGFTTAELDALFFERTDHYGWAHLRPEIASL